MLAARDAEWRRASLRRIVDILIKEREFTAAPLARRASADAGAHRHDPLP
jgi:hypothetical protein